MNRTIARVIYIQIAVTVLGALLAGLWGGKWAAASASAGGATGFVPSLVYAMTVRAAGRSLEKQWRAGYVAECLKIVVTLALFAAIFASFAELKFWPLFLTYIGTLGAYWLVLWFDVPVIKRQ